MKIRRIAITAAVAAGLVFLPGTAFAGTSQDEGHGYEHPRYAPPCPDDGDHRDHPDYPAPAPVHPVVRTLHTL